MPEYENTMLDTLLKSLNIDPMVMLLNAVVFLALLAILNVWFWKPMMKHLDERKHQVSDAYKKIDDTRVELDRLRSDYQARLVSIEADARGRIQETVKDAQAQREAIIAGARQKAEETIKLGSVTLAKEAEATLTDLKSTMDKNALDALTKTAGVTVAPVHEKAVQEYLSRTTSRS